MEHNKFESIGQLGSELRSQVFWDMALWHWASGSRNSKECNISVLVNKYETN